MSAGVGRKLSASGNYGGVQGAGDQRHSSAITGTAAGVAGPALFGSRGQQRGGGGSVSEGMDIFETTDVTYRSIGLHNVDVVADADFGSPSLYRSMTQPGVLSRSSPEMMGAGGVALRKGYVPGKTVSGPTPSNAALEVAASCKPELLVARASIKAMALPAFPFRLEPHTHFYISNKKCAPVAECLQRCFGDERVDSEFEPGGCHWRCARFASGDYVDLRVTVYACGGSEGQGERLCVEFRLSRGNRYEFRRVYQAAVDALQTDGCCLDMPRPLRKLPVPQASRLPVLDISAPGLLPPLPLAPPAPFMREPTPVAAMSSSEPLVSASDEVSPLLGMCRDVCCDTNCEGARLLAQLTSAEDTRASLARDDVVGALAALVVKGAADADEAAAAAAAARKQRQQQPCAAELLCGSVEPSNQWRDPAALARAFAVFALSNLSELADCQELIASTDVLPALLMLAACGAGGPSYVELEERRECARLLANMSGAFGQQIAKEVAEGGKPVKEFLVRCNALHDERLKVHALRVRRLLPESASGTIMAF